MRTLLGLLLVASACGGDVPAKPTWLADVQPILRANCARCHGADPSDPAIASYRLDRSVSGDTSTVDAWDKADLIVNHAVDHGTPEMPPDYALSDRQKQILANWLVERTQGTRPDNHKAKIELIAPTDMPTADQTIDATYRAWDDDSDGLLVSLEAVDAETGRIVPLGKPTGGGIRSVSIDSGTLASKHTFEVRANVDDGVFETPAENVNLVTLIPAVYIDHGAKGTAPSITVLDPNGGPSDPAVIGMRTITWSAEDPEVDAGLETLTFAIDLVQLDQSGTEVGTTPIASGLTNVSTYAWTVAPTIQTTDSTGKAIPYKVRVTASDGKNTRSDDSDYSFVLQKSTVTNYTWADVQPIFQQYCSKCHGAMGSTPAIDGFCLLQYKLGSDTSKCEATDLGAFEKTSAIYTKFVSSTSMPPATEPQPPASARTLVGDWISGGAPEGSGPTDAAPTFTWQVPSNTAGTTASGGMVTLMWSLADAEGLASYKIDYTKYGSTGPNCTVNCSSPTGLSQGAGSVTMGSATGTSQPGSFTWSGAGAGCYCLTGTVVDSANHSVPATAARPVKF